MSNPLLDFSNGLAEMVSAVGSSVVRVDARRRMAATGIVWSADGVIVTANHIVRHDQIQVGLSDGSQVEATLVGRDPTTDLAVVKVDQGGLQPIIHAQLDDVGVGNFVLALGRPGRTVQATSGIVSALGTEWRTAKGGTIDRYLQTDVIMYPGFSGGPLVGVDGKLLGLNSSSLASGVSVAVPTATLSRVVTALMSEGRVKRGFLGVSTQRVKLPDVLRESMEQKSGLMVVSVEPDSPAAHAGVMMGDTIVELDGHKITNHQGLLALLNGDRVGKPLPLHVIRGGEATKLTVTLGERE